MTIVRVHAIQTFAASNLNRDDTGAPKSQVFGGVQRARVSSQCIKAAIRADFQSKGDVRLRSTRTVRMPSLVIDRVQELEPSITAAEVSDILKAALGSLKSQKATDRAKKKAETTEVASVDLTTDALFSVSEAQVDALAALVIDTVKNGAKLTKADVTKSLSTNNAADQKLFGRFYADDKALTIDAACQVAHALGTGVMPEGFDYYTGRDELGALIRDDGSDTGAGAAMVGVKEFTSGPMYRYATVDVDALHDGLGGDTALTADAVAEFIDSFIRTIPSGSQNSYAAHSMPTTVLVEIADNGAGVSFAAAFETPVDTADEASKRLVDYASKVYGVYGNAPETAFLVTLSDGLEAPEWADLGSVEDAVEGVRSIVSERLGAN